MSSWAEKKRTGDFASGLGDLGLGQILDIVPNHMAVAPNNRYWWDILENGSSSRYANYFDIDWQPTESRLQNKVLVPVLGDQYGAELDKGLIQVAREGTQFEVCYGDHRLPVAPETMPVFLHCAAKTCASDTLAFLADSFARLPQPKFTDRAETWARHRDKAVLMGLLERCCAEEPKSFGCIDKGDRRAECGQGRAGRFPAAAELPAGLLARGERGHWVSQVFRHQHADWGARRARAGVAGDARAHSAMAARRHDRWRAGGSCGRIA